MIENRLLRCAVVLGPRKCGTTTLYSFLSQIPNLALPGPKKEAHLFDEGPVAFRQLMRLGRHNLSMQTKAFVDVSTHYFSDRKLWDHVVQTPEVIQVVVIIRDPVERFVSHCLHQMRIKNEWKLTIDKIVARYPEVAGDSFYSEKIPKLFEVFGEENVLLIDFDQLKYDPQEVVRYVCASVGVEVTKGMLPLTTYHQNAGLKPKFAGAYKLLRTLSRYVRLICGERLAERIKQKVVRSWPVGDLSEMRRELERQLSNHQLGETLVKERKFVADILRRGRANSNYL